MSEQHSDNVEADSHEMMEPLPKRSRLEESNERNESDSTQDNPLAISPTDQLISTDPESAVSQNENPGPTDRTERTPSSSSTVSGPSARTDRMLSSDSTVSVSDLVIRRDEVMPNIKYQEGGFFSVRIGDTLIEKYDAVRYLGRGSYATIWMVKDRMDSSYSAIWQHVLNNGHHPNIVQFLDCFVLLRNNSRHFALRCEVMGPSLDNAMNEKNPKFHLELIRKIIKQILEAVIHIHQIGIIHMDLKPSNIMIAITYENIQNVATNPDQKYNRYYLNVTDPDTDILVKIADMGLSRRIDYERTEKIRPTCSYSPPEGFLSLHRDESIDFWSIGCLVYKLVTGYNLIPCNENRAKHEEEHLVLMEETLGLIPAELFRNNINPDHRNFFENREHREYPIQFVYRRLHDDAKKVMVSPLDCDDFAKLVQGFLNYYPNQRLKAAAALAYNFVKQYGDRPKPRSKNDPEFQMSLDRPGTSTEHRSSSNRVKNPSNEESPSSKP
uniref:Protein kinase domain-containing protein n=1 Tax=Caenorhabditis tropicalis TaxID=1561998 RepID=A0A1I7U5N9_9PELO